MARGAQRDYDLPVIPMTQEERSQLLYTLALTAIKQNDVTIGRGLLQEAVDSSRATSRRPRAPSRRWGPSGEHGHARPRRARAPRGRRCPLGAWVAVSDLSRMRIPNRAVVTLAVGFAVVGLACLPLEGWTLADWGWRWTHLAVVLVMGMALNAAGLMGAGDAKFAAAAAPFVALADLGTLVAILAAATLVAWVLHRLARASVGPALAPGWRAWSSGQRFPMGVAFGMTLSAYLALAALA